MLDEQDDAMDEILNQVSTIRNQNLALQGALEAEKPLMDKVINDIDRNNQKMEKTNSRMDKLLGR